MKKVKNGIYASDIKPMKLQKIILFANSVVLLALVVVVILFMKGNDKAGFVDVAKLYNSFSMTIQYKNSIDAEKNKVQTVLDSLNKEYEFLAAQKKSDSQSLKTMSDTKDKMEKLQNAYANRIQVQTEDYNNKILQQLNQYVKEFGDKNRFSFIFGAAGNGSLMYGTESADITDEVIEFANERFQGEPLNE
ncbi:MAG: hypothetical protein A2W93_00655 [Bacteroidetes bacterium GWF2_43_63]|nr:MAG: hypothetical protein A2W94_10995 [Bacteroidetes bacterium GWE2_42_42]OFY54970.1 MAG: hypothetical protein A2W93_00655 [Bacteroidetes bacterium GWF2_43_63]HBG69522.1 hypothetical protein [Bacteroidales bacterium]HCB61311.1 hypothetical protein [Bacteroidales bacterium]